MVLIIDPQLAGISGDMFLCALVDLGADKTKILNGIKKSQHLLPQSSIKKIDFKTIQKNGITCTELILDLDEKIVCMPISVGSGTVRFSHGEMSNPASAILEIFRNSNLVIKGKSTNEELTTPTGASILVTLCNDSMDCYPAIRVDSVGYGAGQKNFEEFSNVLKIVLGRKNHLNADSIKVLETNLDDVSGEILGNLIDKIMKKNAKDVSVFSGITKKNRPTNLLSVMCDAKHVDEIVDTIILETGTLGIRISDSDRIVVPRTSHDVHVNLEGEEFQVHFKKSLFKGKHDFKIEFEDLKSISNRINKSIKETDSLLRKEIEKLE